jgi:hypothetical protein
MTVAPNLDIEICLFLLSLHVLESVGGMGACARVVKGEIERNSLCLSCLGIMHRHSIN